MKEPNIKREKNIDKDRKGKIRNVQKWDKRERETDRQTEGRNNDIILIVNC
jgi:hypothetical protein